MINFDDISENEFMFCSVLGYKTKSKPELDSTNARRWNSEIHSNAVSMSAAEGGEDNSTSGEIIVAAAAAEATSYSSSSVFVEIFMYSSMYLI